MTGEAFITNTRDRDIVEVEVGSNLAAKSIARFAGMWADDETFDEFVEAMRDYRRRVDAGESHA